MLHGRNNRFFFLWAKKFLSNAKRFQCRPAMQHGCRAKSLLMTRTRPKTLRKYRQRKSVVTNWKQWRFLFEKHFNEEEKVVIETWPRLVNKINSWMLASFSTKPEMNDTSYCCFAYIHSKFERYSREDIVKYLRVPDLPALVPY